MTSRELHGLVNESILILEEFCKNSCNANCCKNGFLRLNKKEAGYFIKTYPENIISQKKDFVAFSTNSNCPLLGKKNLCKIHSLDMYPNICKEYPIKIIGDKAGFIIIYHSSCKAVKEGVFDENIRKIRNLGHVVICSD